MPFVEPSEDLAPCIFLPFVPVEGRSQAYTCADTHTIPLENRQRHTDDYDMLDLFSCLAEEVGFRALVHFRDARQVREGYYVQARKQGEFRNKKHNRKHKISTMTCPGLHSVAELRSLQ